MNPLKRSNLLFLFLLLLPFRLAAPVSGQSSDLPPPVEKTVDFATDVAPLLESRCYLCHGPSSR